MQLQAVNGRRKSVRSISDPQKKKKSIRFTHIYTEAVIGNKRHSKISTATNKDVQTHPLWVIFTERNPLIGKTGAALVKLSRLNVRQEGLQREPKWLIPSVIIKGSLCSTNYLC